MRCPWIRGSLPGALVALAALFTPLLGAPPSALANNMTVYSCHTPSGAATGAYDWSQDKPGGTFLVMTNTCAASGAGGLIGELPGRAGGYGDEGVEWTFSAPAWTSILEYKLLMPGNYARPYEGDGEGNTDVEPSDRTDPSYDYRNLGGGLSGEVVVERTPPDEVKYVVVDAGCDNSLSNCTSSGVQYARVEVAQATFLLSDGTTPKITGLTGSLTSGKPLSGIAEASYEASDSGPGIYAAHFVVDDQAQASVPLDSGSPTCENLGETTDGTRAFDSPEPCAASVSPSMGLETTNWTDGEHHVQLIVEDASGNSVSAFNGEVMFDNAPVQATEPRWEPVHEEAYNPENPSEDAAEARAEGTFAAPSGAGTVTTHSFWERCDATGANCVPISGATGAIYEFASADVGSTIRYATTGSDKDGSTTITSPQSAVIKEVEPPSHSGLGSEDPLGGTSITNNSTTNAGAGSFPPATFSFTGLTAYWLKSLSGLTRSYPSSGIRLTGRLLSPSGQALGGETVYLLSGPLGGGLSEVAQAVTDPNGNWTLFAPKGPTRLLRVAYGAQNAAAAGTQLTRDIVEHVRPAIQFHVSSFGPGILAFRAKVGFARTNPPLLAVVQARKGRHWQDVGAPERINGRGAFSSRYSAAALIGNTYVFRVYIPATHLALSATSRAVAMTVR